MVGQFAGSIYKSQEAINNLSNNLSKLMSKVTQLMDLQTKKAECYCYKYCLSFQSYLHESVS